MASPGQAIYTIDDLSDIWARVDVGETELSRVRLGARAEVWTEGNPGRVFRARVSEIGQMGEFATHKDVVRVSHDIKTFRVKARLLEPAGFLKPGMTCRVRLFFDAARADAAEGAAKRPGRGGQSVPVEGKHRAPTAPAATSAPTGGTGGGKTAGPPPGTAP